MPTSLIESVHRDRIPVIQIYGASETGPLAIYQTIDNAYTTVGSIGRAGLHCEIMLMDSSGQPVQPGENGEVWVRGNNVLSHYWNNEEATTANLVDGWFKTGDVARLDSNGDYWFADRIKHVIISGGENIYAAEVERVLYQIENIGEVAVVGLPDEKWGEIPVAIITAAAEQVSDAQVLDACSENLARFKHPKAIIRTKELPRNAMGKVLVDEVRKLALSARVS